MTAPRDPAVTAISTVIAALTDAYSADSSFPPEQPGSDVHFFAGEGPATAAWNAHTDETDCREPFLWVRVMRRYRTRAVPGGAEGTYTCDLPRAAAIEVGVARCAVVEENPSWDAYEAEGVTALEDSWRIETALCVAVNRLRAEDMQTALEDILPFGPTGGIIGSAGVIHVQFAN